jgi:hypothetical protein
MIVMHLGFQVGYVGGALLDQLARNFEITTALAAASGLGLIPAVFGWRLLRVIATDGDRCGAAALSVVRNHSPKQQGGKNRNVNLWPALVGFGLQIKVPAGQAGGHIRPTVQPFPTTATQCLNRGVKRSRP